MNSRTIALFTVLASVLSCYEGKERTKTLEVIVHRLNKAIRANLKNSAEIIKKTDDVFKKAYNKFEGYKIEPSLFLSLFSSMDEKNFKKFGITDKLVEKNLLHYYNQNNHITLGIDKDTREVAIWMFNQISDICGLDRYQPRFKMMVKQKQLI